MKKIIILALATLFSTVAIAQQADLRRKINVSGSAEQEITPDIIYIGISLKEYLENGNSKKKVDITTLEKQLISALEKVGLPKENLSISNLSSWNYTTEKRKNPDFLASKQYRLKVSDANRFNAILAAIDPKGIAYTNIESYDYSKMDELRKELRLKALLSAKQKAKYMTEALGAKLGKVLEIGDSGDNLVQPQVYARSYMMMKAEASDGMDAPEIDFKKIKLSLNVSAVFEITD